MAKLNQKELQKFIVANYRKLLEEGRQREGKILIDLKNEFLGKQRKEIMGKHIRRVKEEFLKEQNEKS